MKKTVKLLFIIAATLILAGGLLFTCVLWASGWDFTKLSSSDYESETKEISEDFDSITVSSDTTDILLALSENGKTYVDFYKKADNYYSVSVIDGALTIELSEEKWYKDIFDFGQETVTVYLPEKEFADLVIDSSTSDIKISEGIRFENVNISISTGDVESYASVKSCFKISATTGDIHLNKVTANSVEISVSTGDIELENLNCTGEIKLEVSTGDAKLENVRCGSLVSTGDTGDMIFKNVIADVKYDIKRSTGDIRFTNCDAGEIYIETSTGCVKGNLLTEKVFIVKSSSGDVDVPETVTGGICKINTSTGDVELTVR